MNYNEAMSERLNRIINYYRLSERQFSQRCGIPPTTMNSIIARNSASKAEFIVDVLKAFPDIDPVWLLMGTGEMLKADNDVSTQETIAMYGTAMLEKKKLSQQLEDARKQIDVLTRAVENLSQAIHKKAI